MTQKFHDLLNESIQSAQNMVQKPLDIVNEISHKHLEPVIVPYLICNHDWMDLNDKKQKQQIQDIDQKGDEMNDEIDYKVM